MTTGNRPTRSIRMLFVVIGAAVSALVIGSCGGGSNGDALTAAPAADGAALYEQNCASCHGDDLRGTDQGPSHLSQVYEPGHHPDESFRAAITQGATAHHWNFGDMAPVPGVDDAEIDAIIAYIRAEQESEGLEAYPPR